MVAGGGFGVALPGILAIDAVRGGRRHPLDRSER